jgi:hypothetical protein
MMAALTFAVALAAPEAAADYHYGAWRGHCYREGRLDGRDHELCTAVIDMDDRHGGVRIERSAEDILVRVSTGECHTDAEVPEGHLPAPAYAGRDRTRIVAAFLRQQIAGGLAACRAPLRVPEIRGRELSEMLRQTDGLKPGSFLIRDPAKRRPMAEQCGRVLEEGWRAGLAAHPPPEGSKLVLMMYTMSKQGLRLADARFESLPQMMEDYVAIGTGPGGFMMTARKPVAAWRNPPSEWFVTVCDVAIEAWSAFVDIGLFDNDLGPPIFDVRARTGVAAMSDFAIWQGGQ